MEFVAVNRRRLSGETPIGAGSDERRLYSQAKFSLAGDTFKCYNSTTVWPISVKFGQMLEKYILATKTCRGIR